jgi:flavin-dependent dehydrogenase
MMYDVIIAGGGPAGASLARLLGKSRKVLLIERRDMQRISRNDFKKCCGGLVAPDAQRLLAELGLGIPGEVLDGPQLFAVRTMDQVHCLERYYQRHYINVNREKFDRWLISLVPSEVVIEDRSTFKEYVEFGKGVQVTYVKDGEERLATASLLVGADGASSRVRRQLAPDRKGPRKYIAIQEYFRQTEDQPYYGSIFNKDITDFYSWTIPKEGFLIVGSALDPNKQPIEKFEELKGKLGENGFDLGKSLGRNSAYLNRPSGTDQILTGKGKVVLIGEAAGWISPSSAEGLSYGFRSALNLAEAIEVDMERAAAIYRRNSKSLFLNIKWKSIKSFLMYNDYTRNIIMRSGVLSMGAIKEKLVEAGII